MISEEKMRNMIGDGYTEKLKERQIAREAALNNFGKALMELERAWTNEDEVIKEIFGGVIVSRNIGGERISSVTELLERIVDIRKEQGGA
jgi:hypothetical protein